MTSSLPLLSQMAVDMKSVNKESDYGPLIGLDVIKATSELSVSLHTMLSMTFALHVVTRQLPTLTDAKLKRARIEKLQKEMQDREAHLPESWKDDLSKVCEGGKPWEETTPEQESKAAGAVSAPI